MVAKRVPCQHAQHCLALVPQTVSKAKASTCGGLSLSWRKGQQWRMDWHVISVPHKIDTNPSPKPKHQLAAKMRASHRAIMLMLRPARAAWGEPVMGQALSHSRRTFSGPLTTPVQTEGHKEALRAAFAHDASIAAAEVAELLRMHLSTGMGCWGRACVLAGSMQQCIRHSASIHAI